MRAREFPSFPTFGVALLGPRGPTPPAAVVGRSSVGSARVSSDVGSARSTVQIGYGPAVRSLMAPEPMQKHSGVV